MEALERAGWTGAAPDFPYHGGPEGYAPTIESFAEFAGDQLAGTPAVIAGHSLGGMVGQVLALHRPDLVRGLVLVDSFSSLGVRCLPGGMEATDPAVEAWIAERSRGHREAMGEAAHARLMESINAFDSRPRVSELRIPVLGIWGGRGQFGPGRAAEVAAGMGFGAVPDMQVVIVPAAGHFVCQETAEEVSAAMVGWLESKFH